MLDKVAGLLSKLKFLGPLVAQVPGIADLIGKIMRIGLAKEDAETVRTACAQWAEASDAIRRVLDEADDVFLAAASAVDEAGDGGSSITFAEIKAAAHEAKDIGPAAAEATQKLGDVYKKLKELAE